MYLNNWDTFEDMVRDFSEHYWNNALKTDLSIFEGIEVLLASYSTGNYAGTAFVLFRKDGELYEVHGNHCSCYGLEGQWEPEKTSIEELEFRLNQGRLGSNKWTGNLFAKELREVLDSLKGESHA